MTARAHLLMLLLALIGGVVAVWMSVCTEGLTRGMYIAVAVANGLCAGASLSKWRAAHRLERRRLRHRWRSR